MSKNTSSYFTKGGHGDDDDDDDDMSVSSNSSDENSYDDGHHGGKATHGKKLGGGKVVGGDDEDDDDEAELAGAKFHIVGGDDDDDDDDAEGVDQRRNKRSHTNVDDDDYDDDDDYGQHGGAEDTDDEDANADAADTDDEDVDAAPKAQGEDAAHKYKLSLKEEIDDEEDEDINYLQKFNSEINSNYILDHHPECVSNNYDEIATLTVVIRDKYNNVIDDLHKTSPFLTKYERARVLGQRAKQINAGSIAFVKVPEKMIDGYLIAELELEQKAIPFIIRRPLPNSGCEYWKLSDLENVMY